MKKLILIAVCAVLMILTTGCEGLFNTIPKGTVMIKKIPKEQQTGEVEYEGILSQDAVKTLSLNAVNKYFGESLTKEEIQFEVMAVDQTKLNELLKRAVYGVVSRPKPERDFTFDPRTELEPISGGLYYITLTQTAEPYEVYDLVLNAKDGEVVKMIKASRKQSDGNTNPVRDPKVLGAANRDPKVLEAANQFVQEKGSYPLSELVLDEKIVRWGNVAEVYYMSEDKQALKYCVMVNNRTKEIVGFSKDVMTLLSYYLGSLT